VAQIGPWTLYVEDIGEILLAFESGLLGSVQLNYLQMPAEHRLETIDTEGSIIWDDADGIAGCYQARLPEFTEANELTEDLQLIADFDDGTIYGLTGN
jgi:predicted dehydrogenase